MMKTISLLGSTGSIGKQTLQVVRELGYSVAALAAGSSVDLMEQQVREFRPRLAVLYDEVAAAELRRRISDTDTEVLSGMDGLLAAATVEADTVVTAMVGMIGLRPTLAAIEKKRRFALANKETLVCAGELVMAAAEKYGAEILPVDSEHSAIYQSLQGCRSKDEIRRLILTCSGGPFYGMRHEELENKTRFDALKHPNWSMGAKVTIDSASMMNKGLEMIEASWLFNLPPEKIEIVVHPQSIVHSLVQFTDGCLKAQLGAPDMRVPIQYALSYPQRVNLDTQRISLPELGQLTFRAPDREKFPAIDLAYSAHKRGGNMACIMNGANEVAVAALLNEKILFGKIPYIIEKTMERCSFIPAPSIEDIYNTHKEAMAIASTLI